MRALPLNEWTELQLKLEAALEAYNPPGSSIEEVVFFDELETLSRKGFLVSSYYLQYFEERDLLDEFYKARVRESRKNSRY